jgi:hypothetical protein
MRAITSSLLFPEGPVYLHDGSVLVVEIRRGTLSRVTADGVVTVVAECGGGPNGAAIGPDGRVYICNNGGFTWQTIDGLLRPVGTPDDYVTGSIQAVDLSSGQVQTLYESCDGHRLKGPNDIVFDSEGGFYFTDLGKRHADALERGSIYYASTDGNSIRQIVHPIEQPNGIALSRDERRLYVPKLLVPKYDTGISTHPGTCNPMKTRLVWAIFCTVFRATRDLTRWQSTAMTTCAWQRLAPAASVLLIGTAPLSQRFRCHSRMLWSPIFASPVRIPTARTSPLPGAAFCTKWTGTAADTHWRLPARRLQTRARQQMAPRTGLPE